jgi:hypothetical protein
MKTVWIYEKADTLMEFTSQAEARAWLKANDQRARRSNARWGNGGRPERRTGTGCPGRRSGPACACWRSGRQRTDIRYEVTA